MRVYISGKITGLPIEEAKALFDAAAAHISRNGETPVNPMELVPYNPEWEWKDYMLKDLELLFDCKAIYMLNNWGSSKGARIERAIAIEHGMEILYQPDNN
jgi:hypothetical protein